MNDEKAPSDGLPMMQAQSMNFTFDGKSLDGEPLYSNLLDHVSICWTGRSVNPEGDSSEY